MIEKVKILLGKNVRRTRKSKGMTQLDLAVKLGTDNKQVRRVENGQTNVTLKTLYRFAQALDTPMHELLIPRDEEEDEDDQEIKQDSN